MKNNDSGAAQHRLTTDWAQRLICWIKYGTIIILMIRNDKWNTVCQHAAGRGLGCCCKSL